MKRNGRKVKTFTDQIGRRDITTESAMLFFEALDHPLERAVWRGEFQEVVSYDVDPIQFEDPSEFRKEYWASESWSKYPFRLPGIDREANAIAAFHESEALCRAANGRLTDWFGKPRPSWMRSAVRRAQALAQEILSGFCVEEVVDGFGYGPGSTTTLSRRCSSQQNKWAYDTAHITSSALPWYVAWVRYVSRNNLHGPGFVRWPMGETRVVSCDLYHNVPKNAKTNRGILIQPDWNSFFQKGVGRALRRRLQRFGLLGHFAKEENMALARRGSLDGSLATVDLKAASDGVSLACCELLLPPALNRVLLSLRSTHGLMPDGTTVEYEKLSAMGNGYTFEVETLLFYCVAVAVCGRTDTRVFGDDIIVRRERVPMLLELLEELGFRPNLKKTHFVGHFRESCGGHYFKGVDVTPPYFRKTLNSLPTIMSAANRVREKTALMSVPDGARFGTLYRYLSGRIPRYLRGPKGLGDSVLVSTFDEATPGFDRETFSYKGISLAWHEPKRKANGVGALLSFLHKNGSHLEFEYDPEGAQLEYRLVPYWVTGGWDEAPAWR